MNPDLSRRLSELRGRMGEAAGRSGRSPDSITLLAVTKTHPIETLRDCYDLGLRDFGENRVQEALSKIPALPPDVRWHLIGQLQTNKINKVLGLFHWIHSVDSIRLAEGLSSRIPEGNQEILLEVNTSGEPTKSGLAPGDAVQAARELLSLPHLRLRGLMTVGPLTADRSKGRDAFKRLRELFEAIRREPGCPRSFDQLSMGMSSDFEDAIEEGSTIVRVGTLLLGDRSQPAVG